MNVLFRTRATCSSARVGSKENRPGVKPPELLIPYIGSSRVCYGNKKPYSLWPTLNSRPAIVLARKMPRTWQTKCKSAGVRQRFDSFSVVLHSNYTGVSSRIIDNNPARESVGSHSTLSTSRAFVRENVASHSTLAPELRILRRGINLVAHSMTYESSARVSCAVRESKGQIRVSVKRQNRRLNLATETT